jgi:hypothetical protein
MILIHVPTRHEPWRSWQPPDRAGSGCRSPDAHEATEAGSLRRLERYHSRLVSEEMVQTAARPCFRRTRAQKKPPV